MTKKIKNVVFGVGGFDESKEDNNVIAYEYYSADELKELSKAEEEIKAREAILAKLGISADEAALLLG